MKKYKHKLAIACLALATGLPVIAQQASPQQTTPTTQQEIPKMSQVTPTDSVKGSLLGSAESVALIKKLNDQYGDLIQKDATLSLPFSLVSDSRKQEIISRGEIVGTVHSSPPGWLGDRHVYYIKNFEHKNFLLRQGGFGMVDVQVFDLEGVQ